MVGKDLIQEVVSGTGLPQDPLQKELERLFERAGVSAEACNLEDLRTVLVEYAQTVLLEVKERFSE